MTLALELFLPYPPSVNTYWGFRGSHRFLTQRAREFKASVHTAFLLSNHLGFQAHRVSLCVYLQAPDKRVRDIDNVAKPLLDALTQAGVFQDDGQVDRLLIVRCKPVKKGSCKVVIDVLPPDDLWL